MSASSFQSGSLFGGILLIAGCCIGAGMLGLPVLSADAGFRPSLLVFAICWLFMVCTAFLLIEVNLWFGKEIGIVTMAERTLGLAGKIVVWFIFLFLFYCLMVAYMAAGGSLVSDLISDYFGIPMHTAAGSLVFCFLFGFLLYSGTGAVDRCNRFLMAGLAVTYLVLLVVAAPYVKKDLLMHTDWSFAATVVPAIIVSFGFHNLIPTLTTYFRENSTSLKRVVLVGSAIPFLVYILWEWLILGIVPLQYFKDAVVQGEIATEALKEAVGISWVSDVAQGFAFFAVATSFLGVALSMADFLADGLKIRKTPAGKTALAGLVLVPPFLCSLVYPGIFLSALNLAGGFGTVILFGILPALMVWKGRYSYGWDFPRIMPGGKAMLIGVMAFALCVMALQLV